MRLHGVKVSDDHSTILRTFPSNTGARVVLLENHRILKSACHEDALAIIQAQADQWLSLRAFPSAKSLYPELIERTPRTLLMAYYEGGSLDSWFGKASFSSLLTRAIDGLFELALEGWNTRYQNIRPDPKAFIGEQFLRRARRLRAASETENGRRFLHKIGSRIFHKTLNDLKRSFEKQFLPSAANFSLGLNAHGDMSLHNIVVEDSAKSALRFIDTRGQCPWRGGLPWWDPIMDLATLISFHREIEPAISEVSRAYGCSAHEPDKIWSKQRFFEALAGSPSFRKWQGRDQNWEQRYQLNCLIRTLGSVSIQLLASAQDPVGRALAVWRVFLKNLEATTETFQ